MPMYRPSELIHFLKHLGITPRKKLSQNFLIDGNVIKKILEVSQISSNDIILEIGPGPGALTEALLEKGATVLAVEKDPVLAQSLNRLTSQNSTLRVYQEDILNFSVEKVLSQLLKNSLKAKVIANLPYHLTTPILERLIPLNEIFSFIIVMVQKEVACRFCASPGKSEYGSFTVFLNFYSRPHYAFSVSKNCFFPIPKVESAVVSFELKKPPLVLNQDDFFKLTRTAFEHRRKMLRVSLRDLYPQEIIIQSLIDIHCNPQARPQELSLQEFLLFFERVSKYKKT